MKRTLSRRRLAFGSLLCLLPTASLLGCFGSPPIAPRARHFDPVPAAAAVGELPPVRRVSAAAHLGTSFVLRRGPRELEFDELHHWVLPVRELVVAALPRGLAPQAMAEAGELLVEAFELDLQHGNTARVVLRWLQDGREPRWLRGEVAASSRAPAACAEAMAAALLAALRQLQPLAQEESGAGASTGNG